MPFNTSVLGRHYRQHTRDLPCTVTIGATTSTGSKGSVRAELLHLEAGVSDRYAFSVWVDAVKFSAAPAVRSTITVDTVAYRVGAVETYADGAGWRLDLVSPTQPDV